MTFHDNFIATRLCIEHSRDILRKCTAIVQQYAWLQLLPPLPFRPVVAPEDKKALLSVVAKLYKV